MNGEWGYINKTERSFDLFDNNSYEDFEFSDREDELEDDDDIFFDFD